MNIKFKERGYSRLNINLLSLIPPLLCGKESLDLCSTIGDPITILQTKMFSCHPSPAQSIPSVPPLVSDPKWLAGRGQDPVRVPGGLPPAALGFGGLAWCLLPYLINVPGNAPWLQHELQHPQVPQAAGPQSPGRQAPHQAVPAVEQILKAKEHSSHASSLCESPQIPCSEATS